MMEEGGALLLGEDGVEVELVGVELGAAFGEMAGVLADELLVGGEDVLRRLVAEFHVVHARLDVGEIQRADKFVVKIEIVHQTAVPDGRVQHLDVGSVGDKITSSVHCCFSSSLDK